MTDSNGRMMLLDDAARAYFGEGHEIDGKALARQHRRGKLRTYKFASRLFTTISDIERAFDESPSANARAPAPAAPALGASVAMAAIRAL
jgi:hypothetical protein